MTARVITLRPRSRGGEDGKLGRPAGPHVITVEYDEDASWKLDAACRGMDPDLWFPTRGESVYEARQVCERCTVRDACLDYAMRHNEKFGVWAGLSERQRRALRRQRRAAV